MAIILTAFLLSIVATLVPISVIYGQDESGGWSEPIPLSTRVPSSWFPDIVVDGAGRIHVVWSSTSLTLRNEDAEDSETGYDVVVYTTSLDSISWEEPVDIFARSQVGGSEALRPSFHVGSRDRLDLTYRFTDVFYTNTSTLPTQPDGWLTPRQISRTGVGYFSSLVEDSEGNLHLVYTQNAPVANCLICYHVLYRQSIDNGRSWSEVIDISLLPTGAAKPQVLIDEEDYIHVVWESGRGGSYGAVVDPARAMYSASYDGGETWTLPMEFETGGNVRNVVIGKDGHERLIVVWQDILSNELNYQFSEDNGLTWSKARLIPEVLGGWSMYSSRHDNYTVATDSLGDLHLVVVGRVEEKQRTLDLLHLVWEDLDGVWSEPEVIHEYTGDVPEWPRLAVGEDDELHLVWYVRDKAHIWETDLGRYQIWYSQYSSGVTSDSQEIRPTETKQPAVDAIMDAEISETHLPTPTVKPMLDPVPVNERALPKSESETLKVLGFSLLPATLFILVAVYAVKKRRS